MNIHRLMTAASLAALIAAPAYATAPYCIAVNGGIGAGGTSFVARNFEFPAPSKCNAWTGYTKSVATYILITNGTACLSEDGKVLTVSVSSADPPLLGVGQQVSDYIRLCPVGVKNCPITSGTDLGYFTGSAVAENCTADLLNLPEVHD